MVTRGRAATGVLVAAVALASASCAGSADGEGGATTTKVDAGGVEVDGARGTFDLLSYNVAGLPAEISKEHPDVNIPKISPKLEPYDVVLTQEDFDWWLPDGLASGLDFVNYHQRLRADATHEYATAAHPGPEAVGIDVAKDRPTLQVGDGLGVLSRLPIDEQAIRVPWERCFGGADTSDGGAGDCLSMKGFLKTTLTLPDGLEVDVYDLHGEAGGSPTDQDLQAADYRQLAAYIAEHSKGRAVIVGGDTNLHTDLEHPDGSNGADIEIWKRFLADAGLTDSCAATRCAEVGAIDKVAYRSGGSVALDATDHRFETKRFVDEDGHDLSDHHALAVRFQWST